MKVMYLLVLIFSVSCIPVYAQNTHVMTIDEHVYDIHYDVNAKVLAMQIDPELNSLLIGMDDTQDSVFSIHLPDEMISAENQPFVVLVDWFETDYETSKSHHAESYTVLEFFVPEGTLEVEIIGTRVIPEFSMAGMLMVLATIMAIGTATMFRRGFF